MVDRPDEELLARVFVALTGPRHPVRDAGGQVPDGPALYAIHGDPQSWQQLGLGHAPTNTALFVGKADASLATRDLPLHFVSGRTGQSTVRRTFAGLLRDHLGLRGLPRNPTKPERLEDYALSEEHDALLTTWMTDHLSIAAWAPPEDCTTLGELEVAVLRRWSPPLNMRDTRSTYGARVTTARKVMTGDARTWAREHGHKV